MKIFSVNKNIALLILLSLTCTVQAKIDINKKYQNMYESCINKSKAINNSVIYDCAETTSEKVKTLINLTYKQLYTKFQKQQSSEALRLLETEQKTWLNYRNASCDFDGYFIGSPMYSICPMNFNIDRLATLTDRLNF